MQEDTLVALADGTERASRTAPRLRRVDDDPEDGLGHGEHRAVAAVDELGERLLVTDAQALAEPGLLMHADLRHAATLSAVRLHACLSTSIESDQPTPEEARMSLARVVSFDGVSRDRIKEMEAEMSGSDGPPEGLPAKEIIVLHDPDAEKSVVVVFFDNEEDYRRGDEALSAMPAGDTPGQRTGVAKYDVAIRMAV
jgi:hypothetical protein